MIAVEFLLGAICGLACGCAALIFIGWRGWWCERRTSPRDLLRGNGLLDSWEDEQQAA